VTHAEFVDAWRSGAVSVAIDARQAGAFLAARLLLPFVAIALIGLGIALVLWGWLWLGLAIGVFGVIGPRLIKRGARGFLLTHIADDASLFHGALRAGAVRVISDHGKASSGTQEPGQFRSDT